MSLTLYFYKCKKGSKPTCKNGTEWASARRVYSIYEILETGAIVTTNKKGYKLFTIDNIIYNRIIDFYKNNQNPLSYDDIFENEFLKWFSKRKIDFNKYDIYVLSA